MGKGRPVSTSRHKMGQVRQQIGLTIWKGQKEKLEWWAWYTDRSISAIIRVLIDEWLEKMEKQSVEQGGAKLYETPQDYKEA